ncbi:SDR family NAD(P)-dependent oxidoreductase [Segetibacter sp. 3557_3]|uniref:SDR family NAD(P)-dependent oxidoreductase n=1 Tax=Segetibacter sp. 3557_3 TaxID=2547429 RepID=UPI00105843C8|nr:SDR family NAD(P)-dependent oxidoreductase [Segetibacter sp. 3557_3]TDH21577.1 SDR family NAD(P)-dependent oxidoreductase [Segetibacter sp. 3557_3]
MSRILITGSADGLGQMAAKLLVRQGNQVILHARNEARSLAAQKAVPGAEMVITGDLSSIRETIAVAEAVNKTGAVDSIIHNAGVGYREAKRVNTVDGLPEVFAVNSLAPYILTCLVNRCKRLVYTSSGLHHQGDDSLRDLAWTTRAWDGFAAYADSKYHNVLLAFAVANRWLNVLSNAVEPGWVATKMGGKGAPDSLEEGPKTQAWLASSTDKAALVTGEYFYHQKPRPCLPSAKNKSIQDQFLALCEESSGISFPG